MKFEYAKVICDLSLNMRKPKGGPRGGSKGGPKKGVPEGVPNGVPKGVPKETPERFIKVPKFSKTIFN